MSKQSPQSSRRRFLAVAGIGSAGAAVAVVASGVQSQHQPVAENAVAADERRGYHVTEHIQKYYKTTLV